MIFPGMFGLLICKLSLSTPEEVDPNIPDLHSLLLNVRVLAYFGKTLLYRLSVLNISADIMSETQFVGDRRRKSQWKNRDLKLEIYSLHQN